MDYKDLTAILLKTAATAMLMWFLASLPGAVSGVLTLLNNPAMHEPQNQMPGWTMMGWWPA